MNFQLLHKQKKFIVIASIIGLIAVFMPWLKVNMFMINKTVSGFSGPGIFTFIAFVVSFFICIYPAEKQQQSLQGSKWLVTLIFQSISLLIIVYLIYQAKSVSSDINDVTDFFGEETKKESKGLFGGNFGIGIWIALICNISGLASCWFLKEAGTNVSSAVSSINIPTIPTIGNSSQKKYQELEQLMELKNKGIITEEEFIQQKSKLLQ